MIDVPTEAESRNAGQQPGDAGLGRVQARAGTTAAPGSPPSSAPRRRGPRATARRGSEFGLGSCARAARPARAARGPSAGSCMPGTGSEGHGRHSRPGDAWTQVPTPSSTGRRSSRRQARAPAVRRGPGCSRARGSMRRCRRSPRRRAPASRASTASSPSKRELLAALVMRRLELDRGGGRRGRSDQRGGPLVGMLTEMLWTIVEHQSVDDFLGEARIAVSDHPDVMCAADRATYALEQLLAECRRGGGLRVSR